MEKHNIFESIKKAENMAKEAMEVAEVIKCLKKELMAVRVKNKILEERTTHRDNIIEGLKARVKDFPTVHELQEENEILRQRINQLNEHIQWQQQITTN